MADNGVTTGLVYYAKLNEGTGTAIADWSGNGLSSVATNGTWTYESMPGTGCLTSADLNKQLCYFTSPASLNTISYFTGEVLSANDYYAFGANMPGRAFTSSSYRYGFQKQEQDPEIWGGAVSFKYRIEDPRLGRFFSIDPLSNEFPWNSTYAFSENRVIASVELEGLEARDLNGNVIFVAGTTEFGGMPSDTEEVSISSSYNQKTGVTTENIISFSYDMGVVFTNEGNPVTAFYVTDASLVTLTTGKDGKVSITETPVALTPKDINYNKVKQVLANCHGFSMSNGNIWIEDSDPLLKDDYVATTINKSSLVVFNRKEGLDKGVAVHSAKRNSSTGLYSMKDRAGKQKSGLDFRQAMGKYTNTTGNFYLKKGADKKLNVTEGGVDIGRGVREIIVKGAKNYEAKINEISKKIKATKTK